MPSVWNFVGDEARTAPTAFVFQVSAASGEIGAAFLELAEATDSDAVAAPTMRINAASWAMLFFIFPPLRTRRPRQRGPDRAPRAARQARVAARGSVEHEETDLVVGNMDRALEADGRIRRRQLLRDRACPPLAGGALSRLATSEVRLNEVARHSVDARPAASR
jgi:hypothetical protein